MIYLFVLIRPSGLVSFLRLLVYVRECGSAR